MLENFFTVNIRRRDTKMRASCVRGSQTQMASIASWTISNLQNSFVTLLCFCKEPIFRKLLGLEEIHQKGLTSQIALLLLLQLHFVMPYPV
mmetsp:Transcript_47074/g.102233  ORF Transcript_47074/g.102233 Transcript_47074/m.102233 type:complete len:91 (+) Transcript_47074:699-971(+)